MTISEVYTAYKEGIDSPTVAGREESFNKSLRLMQELGWDTGALYYDTGNSYYELEQYPWALFYYLKAEKMMPRDREVTQNISMTLQKLELPMLSYSPHIPLSLTEELAIVQMLILVTAVTLSCNIWFKDLFLKPLSKVLIALTAMALLFLGAQYYHTPVQGVLAKAAILYKQPGTEYERVFLDPLPPGTILQVIGASEQGSWTKIVNENGVVGYIQTDKVLL